jgi:hypothetical protein
MAAKTAIITPLLPEVRKRPAFGKETGRNRPPKSSGLINAPEP